MDKNGLSAFLLGLGVGVGIGMLFAPKSGQETREMIKNKAGESGEFLKQKAGETGEYVAISHCFASAVMMRYFKPTPPDQPFEQQTRSRC